MGKSTANQGRKAAKKFTEIHEDIAYCFNEGYTQRRTIKVIGGHQSMVESQYKELKAKKLEEIDNEFINKQKVTKEIAINVVDEKIQKLSELRKELESRLDGIITEDKGMMLSQYLRCIELESTL